MQIWRAKKKMNESSSVGWSKVVLCVTAVGSAFFQEKFWGPVGASPFRESSNANIIVNTIWLAIPFGGIFPIVIWHFWGDDELH